MSAGVKPGDTVAVVGDGAVGLRAVIGAKKLGAAAVKAVLTLTDGAGVDTALECVGADQSIQTAAGITRAGGMIGAVDFPLYETFQYKTLFF